MTFFNEDEKKDGAPVIPSGSSSFKKSSAFGKPMFSRTAGGIMERLKNLSRKDMAFVGIGLSVLVMAPVAEYMTSKPSADNLLTPGFGSREGSSATGGVYEPGINALSQGSPDGSGEVITPLSSRDPASLILGAQPAQAPMAPVSAPPPSTSFRDSMKDVGRNAFSEVSKSAGAPTPIPRMQSALRNFGSFFSGGEGTRTAGGLDGGKIIGDAKSASSKAASRGMVGPVATAGYKGVASNSPHGSSGGAYDKLRSQADRAASNFSGTSAMNSLDRAAADSIDIGKGAGGLGAGGESDKTAKTSNSTDKYEHSRSGESLEEMAAKQRMQKALDWEFFKKYEIPKQIINAIVGAVSTSIGKFVGDSIDGVLSPSSPPAKCYTTVADTPDWEGAKAACAKSTDPKCKLKYVCTDNGGPTVITYQVGDKATVSQSKKCICNEFSGGASSASGSPAGGTPSGSSAQNPIGPGVSPQVISQNTAQNIGDYDTVLKDTVLPALKGYHDLAKKTVGENGAVKAADPDKEKKVADAVKDAFSRLDVSAGKTFSNAIAPKNAEARTALNKYTTSVNETSAKLSSSQAKLDIDNIKKLRTLAAADFANNTCTIKLNATADASGAVVAATAANCKAIVDTIDKSQAFTAATGNFETASGAMDAQRNMSSAFSAHISVMDGDVKAMQTRHAEVPAKVNEILGGSNGMMDKIIAISDIGNAPADTPPPAQKAARTKETIPLRISAMELRGITWDSMWKKEFKSDETVAAEQSAWKNFEEAAPKGSASLAAPDNIEAAFQRPNEMMSAIGGAAKGLADIESMVDTAGLNSQAAISELKKLVDECYFVDGACKPGKPAGGENVPPGGNTPAASSDGRPVATPDNPHRFTPTEYAEVQKAQVATTNCGTAVGGFDLLKEGKCSVEDSARTTGLNNSIPPEAPAKTALIAYQRNAAIACDFVRKCAAKKGSQVEVPEECAGRTTRR